jgi:triphosphoribosyl-dephospho-CoA synthetase
MILTGTMITKAIVGWLGAAAGSEVAKKIGDEAMKSIGSEGVKSVFAKLKERFSKKDKNAKKELMALKGTAEDTSASQEEIQEVVDATTPHIERALEDNNFKETLLRTLNQYSQSGTGNVQQNQTGTGHNIAGDYVGRDKISGDKKIYNIGGIDEANLS